MAFTFRLIDDWQPLPDVICDRCEGLVRAGGFALFGSGGDDEEEVAFSSSPTVISTGLADVSTMLAACSDECRLMLLATHEGTRGWMPMGDYLAAIARRLLPDWGDPRPPSEPGEGYAVSWLARRPLIRPALPGRFGFEAGEPPEPEPRPDPDELVVTLRNDGRLVVRAAEDATPEELAIANKISELAAVPLGGTRAGDLPDDPVAARRLIEQETADMSEEEIRRRGDEAMARSALSAWAVGVFQQFVALGRRYPDAKNLGEAARRAYAEGVPGTE